MLVSRRRNVKERANSSYLQPDAIQSVHLHTYYTLLVKLT